MTTRKKRKHCKDTCRAGMLEHAIKRAQSRLETVATLVAQLTRVFPVAGATGMCLDSVWQDITEPVIQEQLKEVRDGETESETETKEPEHLFGEIPEEEADDGDWTWVEEEEWVDEDEDEEAVEADEESD